MYDNDVSDICSCIEINSRLYLMPEKDDVQSEINDHREMKIHAQHRISLKSNRNNILVTWKARITGI